MRFFQDNSEKLKKYLKDSQNYSVICVLGMHRSGTSCLIGSLQKAGLNLGKHHTWNPHNKQGNRENPDIFELHEDLLACNSGAWNDPPKKIVWSERHLNRAQEIIGVNTKSGLWGFKDPRTLLALDGWKSLLGEITYVGIIRHPVWVATSLYTRDGMSKEKAFDLWNHYNKLLLREYRKQNFPVFSFDWDEEHFHRKLNELLPLIGLQKIPKDERFFTQQLHHHKGIPTDKIPRASLKLYKKLMKICF